MPQYSVNVLYHKAFDKDLLIVAKNEEEASEKALNKVNEFDNVVDSEVTNIELKIKD